MASIKAKLEKFKRMSPADIEALSPRQKTDLLRQMRQAFVLQKEKIESRNYYSPAVEKLNQYYAAKYKEEKLKDPYRMRAQEKDAELKRINEFFNSQTATIPGIQEVNRQQDIRIFGEKYTDSGEPTGKPKRRLTQEQRQVFWSAYNEFNIGADTGAIAGRNYMRLQQALGKIVLSRKNSGNLQNIMDRLKKVIEDAELLETGGSPKEGESVDPIARSLLSGSGYDL